MNYSVWSHSNLMLSDNVPQDGEHAKPYVVIDFQLSENINWYSPIDLA